MASEILLLTYSEYTTQIIIMVGIAIIIFTTAVKWIHRDAKKRGSNVPLFWGLSVGGLLLLGIVPGLFATVVYLFTRGDTTQS